MGGSRAAFRHLGPAHLESPGPGPESPMVRGDFAEPRQAEERWPRLDSGLATSSPWLPQEADGILSEVVTVLTGVAGAVAGPTPPWYSKGFQNFAHLEGGRLQVKCISHVWSHWEPLESSISHALVWRTCQPSMKAFALPGSTNPFLYRYVTG